GKQFIIDTFPVMPIAADFNGDGFLDLAVSATSAVDILLGTGTGSFRPFTSYPLGGASLSLVVADLNGDTAPEVVPSFGSTGFNANSIQALLNTGGTTATLTSSLNPSNFGDSVTFTATVTRTVVIAGKPNPNGTVNFLDGATVIGTGTISAGQAAFTTSTLSVGSHNITAMYAGDANYNPHTSAILVQVVNP